MSDGFDYSEFHDYVTWGTMPPGRRKMLTRIMHRLKAMEGAAATERIYCADCRLDTIHVRQEGGDSWAILPGDPAGPEGSQSYEW